MRKIITTVVLVLAGTLLAEQSKAAETAKPDSGPQINLTAAHVVVLPSPTKREQKAAAMLLDEVEKRSRLRWQTTSQLPAAGQVTVVLGRRAELERAFPALADKLKGGGAEKPEGYQIVTLPSGLVIVAGNDERGVLFGTGRLLRLMDYRRDGVSVAANLNITDAPRFPLRGHQLGYRPKTHAYDAWSLPMWEQYYREMIVFGMNAVELIPPRSDDDADSPHFPKPPMEMMTAMSQLADDYALDVWIWYPALDKDYTDSKTVEFALKEREEVFKKLPRVDVLFFPGGDPGNTRPDILFPLMEKTKPVLNRYHPKAQIWVSPQGFDRKGKDHEGWLKLFFDIMQKEQPKWLDGVVFGPQVETSLENLRKQIPAQYPIRQYPDITHSRGCQYPVPNWDKAYSETEARECINPRPESYAKIFRELMPFSTRFITYSEGCNDDFNKVLWSCLGWNPDMTVENIAREYSRFFINGRYEETYARGLRQLEQNWVGPVLANEGVNETLRLFQEMEQKATPQDKLNWRFQQGLYRAYYDAYIRARVVHETKLEQQARAALQNATQAGSLAALDQAEKILDKAEHEKPAPELRARVFELAEALYQSIRMQLSVPKYQAIRVGRGTDLDTIDKPLNLAGDLKKRLGEFRELSSEADRLAAIKKLTTSQ